MATIHDSTAATLPVATVVSEGDTCVEGDAVKLARLAKETASILAATQLETLKSQERIALKRAEDEAFNHKVSAFVAEGKKYDEALRLAAQFDQREASIKQKADELEAYEAVLNATWATTVIVSMFVGGVIGARLSKL